jgi:diaminopimelate decarboxylase
LENAFSTGCLINLDSLSLLDKLPAIPEKLCFRYNPGPRRKQGAFSFIGNPAESKFGISYQQVVEAYQRAVELGVRHFGMHTMHTNNTLDYRDKVESARLLLSVVEEVEAQVGITLDFINLGGGLGIPYHPDNQPLDIQALAAELALQLQHRGHKPAIYLESGRYMTGPHGVLVTTVTNIKSTYRTFVGVDASMSALMRPGMYGAYHHITVPGKEDLSENTPVDVVGSICENTDKFAIQRLLPELDEGDIMIIHDTGAHGHAMGFTYNGRLRPKELLLRNDGVIELIRRSETFEDYTATLSFPPDVLLA